MVSSAIYVALTCNLQYVDSRLSYWVIGLNCRRAYLRSDIQHVITYHHELIHFC